MEVIRSELLQMCLYRHVWLEVQAIIRHNKEIQLPSVFYSFLGQTYVAYAVSAVRRQIKSQPQSISLKGLLEEIASSPTLVSRSYFLSLHDGSPSFEWASDDFSRIAKTNDDHISEGTVRSDLQELARLSKSCEAWADRRVAHFDKRPPVPPTFNELDELISQLEAVFLTYSALLTAQGISSLTPTIQNDWQAVFRHPWIANDEV